MPDEHSRKQTGSRDDVVIDQSRCLLNRYSGSSCHHCVDICPHQAVRLDEQLTIDPELCCGCLLCTTVCPSGAVEHQVNFQTTLAQLAKTTEPVLGCYRTAECANASLPCLGGLSEEHLLSLCHQLNGRLTLNLTRCQDCLNRAILPALKSRLTNMTVSGLTAGSCTLIAVESQGELNYQSETVDRRSFFRSLRCSLFQTAAVALQSSSEQVEHTSSYGDKRVPLRRKLFNDTILKQPKELQRTATYQFVHQIRFTQDCTACQGCVAICPTGALVTAERGLHPIFKQEYCTGCSLCVEFCLDRAAVCF